MKPTASLRLVLKSTAIAILMLAAEAFAVAHPLDLDAHSGDDPCKICLSVASFGSAATAENPSLVIDSASVELVAVRVIPCSHPRAADYFARGPPLAS